jgi:hypothetical protein
VIIVLYALLLHDLDGDCFCSLLAGGNIPPFVSMTSPSATATYTAPTTLAAAVAACDLDGAVQKVMFFQSKSHCCSLGGGLSAFACLQRFL